MDWTVGIRHTGYQMKFHLKSRSDYQVTDRIGEIESVVDPGSSELFITHFEGPTGAPKVYCVEDIVTFLDLMVQKCKKEKEMARKEKEKKRKEREMAQNQNKSKTKP